MRFLLGSDDSDPLVGTVRDLLERRDHEVVELPIGRWPEVARRLGEGVAGGEADQGVLFCGTGTSMAANKVPGVRAALAWDPWIAQGAREWNDANVLVMSLKRTDAAQAEAILDAWLAVAEPDPEERRNIDALRSMDS
ncbi:MAG: RpiB/LacA/LacB family sugar-phosphate isomerase [Solirubrobacterales bacterium]